MLERIPENISKIGKFCSHNFYIFLTITHIQVRENLCQSDCHTICKEITITLCIIVLPATIYTVVFFFLEGGRKGNSIKIYYIKV